MTRLLLVDDEANLRHALGYALRQEGYDVATADDGESALAAFRSATPDAVILDLMLPRVDGLEVARRIRRESDVPILMLTARDTELDRVVGLEIGADDYLGKPFSTPELVARVRALLRRSRRTAAADAPADAIERAGIRIDVGRHRVTSDGREIELRPKEFDLLAFLIARPGQVFSREQLLAGVWGTEAAGLRTVDTHVKQLRARLGEGADRIETVRGVGYRFRE